MGKHWKQCQTWFFLGSKITADGECSHEIKRRLLLGRKVITNLDSTLKSRDVTLPTKVRLVKAMVFPVVVDGCETWTVKKVECRRIDPSGEPGVSGDFWVNSSVLSFLHSPTLTSIHDYWKNHSLD